MNKQNNEPNVPNTLAIIEVWNSNTISSLFSMYLHPHPSPSCPRCTCTPWKTYLTCTLTPTWIVHSSRTFCNREGRKKEGGRRKREREKKEGGRRKRERGKKEREGRERENGERGMSKRILLPWQVGPNVLSGQQTVKKKRKEREIQSVPIITNPHTHTVNIHTA